MKIPTWLIGLILLVVLLVLLTHRVISPEKTTTNNVAKLIALQQDTSKQYVNKAGKPATIVKVVTDPNAALVRVFYKKQIDSLAKLHDTDAESIKGFGQIITELRGEVVAKTRYRDTSRRVVDFSWTDGYTKFDGSTTLSDTPRTRLKYGVMDTLSYAFFNKKRNLLQKIFKDPTQMFDVSSRNPAARFQNTKSVMVPENQKSPIKVGLYGGYGASYYQQKVVLGPQVGAGVTYNF